MSSGDEVTRASVCWKPLFFCARPHSFLITSGYGKFVSKYQLMNKDVQEYHDALVGDDRAIADVLFEAICNGLPKAEYKIWHRHPVWFLDGNPVAGYSKLKNCMRLLFWSGQSFDEPGLHPEGSFKAAEARYIHPADIDTKDLKRWIKKSAAIQWDYKNIVKRKGALERLL